MRWMLILVTAVALAGCAPGADLAPAPAPVPQAPASPDAPVLPAAEAARAFVEVMTRVEPMAEAACRDLARAGTNCAFDIRVDPRPEMEPNAFQTVDETGRPLVIFTLSLIADARNADELAFVLGHEAAHHILGHIPRRQETAARGAMLGAVYGTVTGADEATMKQLQEMGAQLGARRYSKSFELEADALGAEIAWRAGFDPVRGTGFFDRLPDPGDAFLGSHPPNGQRRAQVAAVVARLSQLSAAQ
ncbi:M48 family metallopeptidase [Gemmobacter serpentinus]|uniref:M48 family metallopeptidase n=1 Tax=Gemmobacter serpentinus TaxID=2652247 RepID=UPI00124DB715|nr:M48 family metallopeptidase [Gemmobacter serpentinus]